MAACAVNAAEPVTDSDKAKVYDTSSKSIIDKIMIAKDEVVRNLGVKPSASGGNIPKGEQGAKPPNVLPFQLPMLDGEDRTHEVPAGPKLIQPPNGRELFDLVIACWPERSLFRGEIALEGRLNAARVGNGANNARWDTGSVVDCTTNGTGLNSGCINNGYDPVTGSYSTSRINGLSGRNEAYIGVVARIPLFSALEIDREREREALRREKIAAGVGKYVTALADHTLTERELVLYRALEKRAQERIAAGVTNTDEQVKWVTKVSELESKLIKARSELVTQRVTLAGMCTDDKAPIIDRYLKNFSQIE